MPATDYQSLLSSANISCYNNLSLSDQALLKLALLQIIANALSPMTATDPQSLLSSQNVACYRSIGSYPLLELALLQIIANNIGGGGGGGSPDYINYAGPPSGSPSSLGIANIIVDVNGRQWMYWGGTWN